MVGLVSGALLVLSKHGVDKCLIAGLLLICLQQVCSTVS